MAENLNNLEAEDLDLTWDSKDAVRERQEKLAPKTTKKSLSFGQKVVRVGVTAAVVATAGTAAFAARKLSTENASGTNIESVAGGETFLKIKNAPREMMTVAAWGEVQDGLSEMPTTLSELRDKAGWDLSQEAAFIEVMNIIKPGTVSESLTIQPGNYEVPVNK